MKKAEEKKFKKSVVDIIGENYKSSDDILVQELVDWISIAQAAKEDLRKDIKENGTIKNSWGTLTTLSMCTKSILNCLKSLGITPAERSRLKVVEKAETKFDLNKFLNEN